MPQETVGAAFFSEFLNVGLVVQFGVPPHRIDLINSIDGVSFPEAWVRRKTISVKKADSCMSAYFIGLEDLIKNKEAAGRPKDLDDLDFLRDLPRQTLTELS